uniref:Serine/threonine-protein phosphatase n=1 Tax=Arcella intermedia TaxID=1963864 RepID=A0A6B2L1X1_9EUKA
MPTKERIVSNVETPAGEKLRDEQFWDTNELPNVSVIKEHLRKEGRISDQQMKDLLHKAHELLCEEDNVLYIDAPLTVCGDIHGQFYDLLKLFDIGGDPKTTRYLFLGDYVDRGNFSVECVILLLIYKVLYPNSFYLLRGNHECRHVTQFFSFKEECIYKYSEEIYSLIMDTFDDLPLAAIMNKQFFCCHGGISPEIQTIDDIQAINRFREPPNKGPMCDLLWADPMEDYDSDEFDNRPYRETFTNNSVRGCSYYYSFQSALKFLEKNRLLSIIRAHEAQSAGYRMYRRNEKTGFPSVITLFSAPNYLDVHGNKAAILRYENNVFNIRQFNCSPHPYFLPGFMNVFDWSLPFVAEKVAELLWKVFKLVDDQVIEQEEEDERKRNIALKRKVMLVGKMLTLCQQMREEREAMVVAGTLLPSSSSLSTSSTLSDSVRTLMDSTGEEKFGAARKLDMRNEARPPAKEKEDLIDEKSPELLRRHESRDKILTQKKRLRLAKQQHIDIIKRASAIAPIIDVPKED